MSPAASCGAERSWVQTPSQAALQEVVTVHQRAEHLSAVHIKW